MGRGCWAARRSVDWLVFQKKFPTEVEVVGGENRCCCAIRAGVRVLSGGGWRDSLAAAIEATYAVGLMGLLVRRRVRMRQTGCLRWAAHGGLG